MKSVCLAILNYNGRKHLEQLLPTASVAAKKFPGNCSILVLDNRSTENDAEWMEREFPGVEVVVAPKNDFLFSYNEFAERRSEDLLVFLNNDLKLKPDFIAPLARHFVSDDVFAASATSRDWNDQVFTCGPVRLQTHHGVYWWDYERDRQQLCHTLFCSGGFMAVDRKKFIALGGFNRLFQPAYGEDLDLSFRAWRKGWRCIFEPDSVVLHRENGTWNQSGDSRAARLGLRSQLLFQWSSLPPTTSCWERAVMYGLAAFRELRRGNTWWLSVWFATWQEWRRKRADYSWMMASRDEVEEICRRMEEPIHK